MQTARSKKERVRKITKEFDFSELDPEATALYRDVIIDSIEYHDRLYTEIWQGNEYFFLGQDYRIAIKGSLKIKIVRLLFLPEYSMPLTLFGKDKNVNVPYVNIPLPALVTTLSSVKSEVETIIKHQSSLLLSSLVLDTDLKEALEAMHRFTMLKITALHKTGKSVLSSKVNAKEANIKFQSFNNILHATIKDSTRGASEQGNIQTE